LIHANRTDEKKPPCGGFFSLQAIIALELQQQELQLVLREQQQELQQQELQLVLREQQQELQQRELQLVLELLLFYHKRPRQQQR
jgi:hypothetical protein